MPVKMDTTVTVIDVAVIASMVIGGAGFIFGYGGSISTNSQEIEHNAESIARIERQSEQHEQKMVKLIEKNTTAVELSRTETKSDLKGVVEKLDKIIERELNGK